MLAVTQRGEELEQAMRRSSLENAS